MYARPFCIRKCAKCVKCAKLFLKSKNVPECPQKMDNRKCDDKVDKVINLAKIMIISILHRFELYHFITLSFFLKRYGCFWERHRESLPVCPEEDGTVTTNEQRTYHERISNGCEVTPFIWTGSVLKMIR